MEGYENGDEHQYKFWSVTCSNAAKRAAEMMDEAMTRLSTGKRIKYEG